MVATWPAVTAGLSELLPVDFVEFGELLTSFLAVIAALVHLLGPLLVVGEFFLGLPRLPILNLCCKVLLKLGEVRS